MIGSEISSQSLSLRKRIKNLEHQILKRPERLRSIMAGIKHKIAARMVSPGMLLAATGIGVAMEQTSHHRRWSLLRVLDAGSALLRLLLSVSTPVSPPGTREYRKQNKS